MRQPRRDDTIAISVGAVRRLLLLVVALLVLAAAAWLVVSQRDRLFGGDDRRVDHAAYQAVFLVSSQVYFGKLTIDGDDYLLRDVFYLNAPAGESSAGQLVKRGNELHGPIEPMVIPAKSVLFFENMRDDSQVLAAIRAFKSGATPAPATAAPAAPAATPSRPPSPSATR